jgi:hypothetical protein
MKTFTESEIRVAAFNYMNDNDCANDVREFISCLGVPLIRVVLVRDERDKDGNGTLTQNTRKFLDIDEARVFAPAEMKRSQSWPVGPWTSFTIYDVYGSEIKHTDV